MNLHLSKSHAKHCIKLVSSIIILDVAFLAIFNDVSYPTDIVFNAGFVIVLLTIIRLLIFYIRYDTIDYTITNQINGIRKLILIFIGGLAIIGEIAFIE